MRRLEVFLVRILIFLAAGFYHLGVDGHELSVQSQGRIQFGFVKGSTYHARHTFITDEAHG